MPPQVGGSLRVAVADKLATPAPETAWSFSDWILVRQVHAGLYREVDGEFTPDLAQSVPQPIGSGRFRIQLRQNAVFHDGRRVSSSDVTRMWRRARAKGITLREVDNTTIELSGRAALKSEAVVRIFAEPLRVITGERPYIGAGPFAFRSQPSEVVLNAHLNHHLGRPWLDQLIIRHGLGIEGVVRAFRYDRADLIFQPLQGNDTGNRRDSSVRTATGPVREVLGLFVLPGTDKEERRIVMTDAPRRRIGEVVPGGGRAAYRPSPHDDSTGHRTRTQQQRSSFRWYIGTASATKPLVLELSAVFSSLSTPWAVQIAVARTLRDVVRGIRRSPWSAALFWWYHATGTRAASAEQLKRAGAGITWVPLVERSRIATYRSSLSKVQWDSAGLVDFGSVWRQ